jgi:hypothetical protein
MFQYHVFLAHLFERYPHRPVLFPLQPHISQDIFHPRYLTPHSRHNTAHRLAALMEDLGWADAEPPTDGEDESDATITPSNNVASDKLGVTVLSHSK